MAKDPKCGMALEPQTVTAGTDDEEHAGLRDMTKRFWIGSTSFIMPTPARSGGLPMPRPPRCATPNTINTT